MNPKSIRHYAQEFYPTIPKEAFKPAHYKLLPMFLHAFWIFTNIAIIHFYPSLPTLIVCSILIGISIACLFLFSHELSHGTIVRKKKTLLLLKNFFWAFSGIPPTVWHKVHNLSHHIHMNTIKDPDRKTFKSEDSFWNRCYNVFIYPNKKLRYSITVGCAMMFYSIKHIVAALYPADKKPDIVTYKPEYTPKEKTVIKFELCYIIAFWSLIYFIVGWQQGIILSIISWYTYSALVICFIVTQHLGNDVFIKDPDPLLTTTSVIIPRWLDRIIDMHSFHVEHHIFPAVNFDYYPQISSELHKAYPQRYNRISIWQALRQAFDTDVLIDDPLL